jgi:dynactin complex subunit
MFSIADLFLKMKDLEENLTTLNTSVNNVTSKTDSMLEDMKEQVDRIELHLHLITDEDLKNDH